LKVWDEPSWQLARYGDRGLDICQTLQIDMHALMRARQPLSIGSTLLAHQLD
jgi:hypothetical protein